VFGRNSVRGVALFLVFSFLLNNIAATERNPQHLNSPCNIHLSYLGDKYDPVNEFGYDTPPQQALAAADRQLDPTVSTYIVAPATTVDFERIFGRQPSSREADDMKAFQKKAKDSVGEAALSRQLTAKNFEGTLTESKSSFEILVGHNDGGSFKFADGSALNLADMVEAAGKHAKQLILVSCRAVQNSGVKDALGTAREITYPEGLFIAESLAKSIRASREKLSISGVKDHLKDVDKQADFKFNVKYLILQGCAIAAAGIAIGLLIYVLDDERKKRLKHSPQDPEKKPTTQDFQAVHAVAS
jgi:hypothetical protein